MLSWRWLPVASLLASALVALGAAPRRGADMESLLRQGNAAFARGDYAEAVRLYEEAEARATDPGLVTFNLASAKYHLALTGEGGATALSEAERLYRCCLAATDPRRPRALFGLGNCLLLRAASPDDLRAALDAYSQCLRATTDKELKADASHNRQRARLLLAQALAQGTPPDDPSGEDKDKRPDPPDKEPPASETGGDGADGQPDDRSGSTPIKPEPGDKMTQTDAPPAPGAGNLQPIPDRTEPASLTKDAAAEHLERATRQILAERQAYQRGKTRKPAPGVRDW
jgi:tetratricopeptide (TPR) repeat protein